ncbi:MAG: inositol monophosphatase [Actinomycetota bacterium]|nr:inositol monophosphatase [Actinomycetota bacterium]
MDDGQLAIQAARAGAEVVRAWMGRLEGADFKGEVDPVTEADRQAEAAILDLIGRHRPGDAILSEEVGSTGSGDRQWIVDPLDGTVNFVHGVPHVAVSVGLFEAGTPAAGAVIDVFRQEEFLAAAGQGVWLDGRRQRVTERSRLGESLVATGFPYDRQQHATAYAAWLGSVLGRVRGVRRMGTAALDLAWVAVGRYDGYWEAGLGPWDGAAGLLLVREGGGVVTDQHGEPYQLGDRVVVASNGKIHDELRHLVAESLPQHLGRM